MKVFITGGTGFIGSYIVKELVERGDEVTILARNPDKVSGFIGHPKISFEKGAMDDREAIAKGLAGKDACVHVALAWGDTAEAMLLNETLTSVWLFEAAAQAGVQKIIFTSSIAAFGSAPNDDNGPLKPGDYYGATKAAAEAYLMAVGSKYKVKVNVVRPGYTFGNPAVEGGFIYTDIKIKEMVKSALANEPMAFPKYDGTQFIWAGDLAKIYVSLLHSELDRGYYTGVSSEFCEWGKVAQMAVEALGSKSVVTMEDKGRKAPEGLPIDVSQTKNTFGYEFTTDKHMRDHIEYLKTIV